MTCRESDYWCTAAPSMAMEMAVNWKSHRNFRQVHKTNCRQAWENTTKEAIVQTTRVHEHATEIGECIAQRARPPPPHHTDIANLTSI